MPNSIYNVVLVTEFDQELFDQCYADSDADMHTKFTQNIIKNHNALDYTARKTAIESDWKMKFEQPEFTAIKIINSNTGLNVGYILGKIVLENIFVIYYNLYLKDDAGSTQWVHNLWEHYFPIKINDYLPNQKGQYLTHYHSTDVASFVQSLKEKYSIINNYAIKLYILPSISLETIYSEQGE